MKYVEIHGRFHGVSWRYVFSWKIASFMENVSIVKLWIVLVPSCQSWCGGMHDVKPDVMLWEYIVVSHLVSACGADRCSYEIRSFNRLIQSWVMQSALVERESKHVTLWDKCLRCNMIVIYVFEINIKWPIVATNVLHNTEMGTK